MDKFYLKIYLAFLKLKILRFAANLSCKTAPGSLDLRKCVRLGRDLFLSCLISVQYWQVMGSGKFRS